MNRITSADGVSVVGEDLIPAMRAFTSIAGKDDKYYTFRPTMSYFESDIATTVSINGENPIPLKFDGVDRYTMTLDVGMVLIKSFVITNVVSWQATFLY